MFGQAYLPLRPLAQTAPPAAAGTDNKPWPPKHLLVRTFPSDLLAKSLMTVSTWHPYPTADDRAGWTTLPEELRADLIKRAEAILGTEWQTLSASVFLDYSRTGNRTSYEHPYFARRRRLTDLVLGEGMEAEGRFLDEIVNGIWLICDEAFWGVPAHLYLQKAGVGLPDVTDPVVDLFAAETSATLSWISYLLGSRLDRSSPRVTERIRIEAKRRILDPVLQRTDFGWMGLKPGHARLNNWNPWINSNCLATTLLLEQDSTRRLQLVQKICASLDEFLADYSPDGGCEEGPVYWQRSAASYFDCCWLLVSATNGAANPLEHPFIAKMGQYIADVHIAGRFYVNYGDAHMEDAPSPELVFRFGQQVHDRELQDFGAFASNSAGLCSHGQSLQDALSAGLPSLARSNPDLLAVPSIQKGPRADALGRDSWYPALGLMTAREQEGRETGFYLAVQAGNNGRSHGHNDTGSFIVFHNGEPVFIDVGVEAYTAKTFSAERYSIWTMQSAYHNLPTINGIMQHQGKKYCATDVRYESDDAQARLSMNLAAAYPPEAGVDRWLRELTLLRDKHLITVQESFRLKRSGPVMLTFMTPRPPSTGTKGIVALQCDRGSVHLEFDSFALIPTVETIEVKDEGLRRSWGPTLYRVLLKSAEPMQNGAWTLRIRQHEG